nr:hypothetical protein [Paenibacillus jamilae]
METFLVIPMNSRGCIFAVCSFFLYINQIKEGRVNVPPSSQSIELNKSCTGTDTVPGNSPITFTGVLANVGGAFTFIPPSPTITINETGSYFISFSIHNQGDAAFNLTVNGTPITPLPFTGNGGGPTAAEVIITVTTVPTTIQLVNANATPAQLHNNINTTMTILKLAP